MTYFMGELASIHKDRGRFIAHSMSFVRERAVAEDIYSESIVKILEKKDIFVEGSNVRGYFHRVVMSKSYDYVKRESMLSSAHREIRDTALRDAMFGILAERDSNGMAFLSDLNERIAECRRKLPQKSFDIFVAKPYGRADLQGDSPGISAHHQAGDHRNSACPCSLPLSLRRPADSFRHPFLTAPCKRLVRFFNAFIEVLSDFPEI